ncbi:hypothetical protein COT99_00595 [Candidatus Falkowbacteria bacterium CG10_big_fil_rev_8_21_14_0_10_43_10]|uniref:Methyltransferase type 11 domain-containing protein n=1 Tax=Candidatus Falkowbacteria bacterium CG10_big_fil_rev_8_21_14_0_10_43_10 TaxID=1974567 RepID=A0A2H0V341_9BACT|nr:MAG: hypothetical protein COT99_00595 [Candidatus Falkowbacteria bacterium CG10_big_fil_rev_8_21_14_0_10_43_10]
MSNEKSWSYLAKNYDKLVKPPSRPCKEQLKIWDKIIRQKMGRPAGNALIGNALILGATPELRDLALKNKLYTWSVDINEAMMEAMTKLMKRANIRHEARIIKDWQKVFLPEKYFDIIMMDAALNNLLTDAGNKAVIKRMANWLAPDGIVLMRNLVIKSLKNKKTVKYWFNRIQKKEAINFGDLSLLFRVDSGASTLTKSPSIVDSAVNYQKVMKQFDGQNKKVKIFLEKYYQLVGKDHKKFFAYEKSDFEKMLKKYFKILPVKKCGEHFSCRAIFPAYYLKKKHHA